MKSRAIHTHTLTYFDTHVHLYVSVWVFVWVSGEYLTQCHIHNSHTHTTATHTQQPHTHTFGNHIYLLDIHASLYTCLNIATKPHPRARTHTQTHTIHTCPLIFFQTHAVFFFQAVEGLAVVVIGVVTHFVSAP